MSSIETEIKKAIEVASAHAYLVIARRCVENARTRPYIGEVMGTRLLELYGTLDRMLEELHEMGS